MVAVGFVDSEIGAARLLTNPLTPPMYVPVVGRKESDTTTTTTTITGTFAALEHILLRNLPQLIGNRYDLFLPLRACSKQWHLSTDQGKKNGPGFLQSDRRLLQNCYTANKQTVQYATIVSLRRIQWNACYFKPFVVHVTRN
jgi:hypothetical protein